MAARDTSERSPEEIRREMTGELERMREQGLAAPWPADLTAREFKD